VLSTIGLPVAVIPHYNNAEGGHHDTRFRYLGERRLAAMEQMLPGGAFVLGVDEHTGVVLDLDADTATVVGLGVLTIRRNGVSTTIPSGETVPIDVLRSGGPGRGTAVVAASASAPSAVDLPTSPAASLACEAEQFGAAFDAALGRRDAAGAVAATLKLDAAIVAWSADTMQSDEVDRARALLRSMIVLLGDAAVGGLANPRAVLAPLVEVALSVRTDVRAAKRYDLSDQIRDGLAAAGIEVRDTAEGQTWDLKQERQNATEAASSLNWTTVPVGSS
jgi:hypothetical protein